ncbi:hypothetical protein PC129_g17469 [Phytophthora cactorum]|uniref:Uncharacterized protein n=1 Tax=Phytophthora cactorum TaxID=29920 RepID=A0A329RNM6_9STRA|nr:hypothetical protein Pcac1_g14965 [Phytophthora cactorum]KAG2815351.1 hypothetical protein PC112_g13917 [Phytophthora cactorum]KAG2816744.1 hypothetical protein PC111_g13020 [Phytophthora cactorum]KAG2853103.1 hypothetical protein PC113_g14454 [Phytophthora cactorum]KAG2895194.1 hypothetical protein PC114_g15585 [Phytophthora cactorum]
MGRAVRPYLRRRKLGKWNTGAEQYVLNGRVNRIPCRGELGVGSGGDNADLRSNAQGVNGPEPTCGGKGTYLVNSTNQATMHRLGSAETGDNEVGTHSVEEGSVETLRLYYLAAVSADEGESDAKEFSDPDRFEPEGTDFDLTDYAHELAFLSGLAKVVLSVLDYDAPNVKSSCHTPYSLRSWWKYCGNMA